MSEDLPYNPEAEAAVLGCILIDDSKIEKVREILDWKDFYDPKNGYIFRGMEWLNNKGTPIDLLTLSDALKEVGYLDVVGGAAYLTEVTNYVPTSVRVLEYAKIVAEDSAKRKIKQAADEIGKGAGNGKSLEETLEIVREQIDGVNKIGGKQNKFQVASMLDYVDAAKERFERWNQMQGLSTGFPSIDKLTLGLVGGELVIVAGPTSKGKTLLSMNIANNVAKSGGRVLFVTLEMTHEELTSRYMYANGGADTTDFATVAANTIFQVNDELDWQDVDGLMKNAKEQLDVDLVVIDHLHYFTRELQNVAEDLGRITKEFKKNAKRYNIPVILISHIRKMGKDEELSGESLRGSSLIAQDADIVLMINRDPETNQMGVLIDKNRNRGKLSDRTKYTEWVGDEREVNTIYLDFNNTKLVDPYVPPEPVQQIFPGATVLPYKDDDATEPPAE
jgi:replicative DNA helicase